MKGPQQGSLPATASFCQVSPHNVVLLALKPAEDGRGYIVRLTETEGRHTEGRITLPFLTVRQAKLTNLVEEDLHDAPIAGQTISLSLGPFATVTVRLLV